MGVGGCGGGGLAPGSRQLARRVHRPGGIPGGRSLPTAARAPRHHCQPGALVRRVPRGRHCHGQGATRQGGGPGSTGPCLMVVVDLEMLPFVDIANFIDQKRI
jgi:hypothetical protein